MFTVENESKLLDEILHGKTDEGVNLESVNRGGIKLEKTDFPADIDEIA